MKKFNFGKVNKTLIWFLRGTIFLALFFEIYEKNWLTLFITILALVLTFLPRLFEKRYKVNLSTSFELLVIFFIYLSLYLGEVYQFYYLFWWWDILLHLISAITIGLIGFIIVIYLYQGDKIRAKPLLLCLLVFCFAVAAGAIWEIFEFVMDQSFGLNMQKSGLIDTMTDLIMDALGALISSAIGYIYLINRKSKITFSISSFIKNNPSLFKKKRR